MWSKKANKQKKKINKEYVMAIADDEDFENSVKYWVCDND